MKCDYCENESTCSFGAVLKNKTVDIFACDKHWEIARNKQRGIIDNEAFKNRIEIDFNRPILYQTKPLY